MALPIDPIRDVMNRTMFNLEFVRERATKKGPYEVTQLVNSFLGAVCHPWEKYPETFKMTFAQATKRGCPYTKAELQCDKEPANVAKLVNNMRDAIAHGNISFEGTDGDISSIKLWVCPPKEGHRTWGVVFTVAELRQFLDFIVQAVNDQASQSFPQA